MSEIEIHRLDTFIEDHAVTKLIALSENKFVGCLDLEHASDVIAGFRQLFVEEDERHRGIATALLEEASQIAREAGHVSINATLAASNRPLFPTFYQPLGFVLAFIYPDASAMIARPLNP